MKLSELKTGERGRILRISGDESFRKRITELGFGTGVLVESVRKAPFEDPVAYRVRGTQISLRNAEAGCIEVVAGPDTEPLTRDAVHVVVNGRKRKTGTGARSTREIHVALVGNPNCGKTSIFNFASKSKEKVANYSGVTVSRKEALVELDGYRFKLVDLPGAYSLSSNSPDEKYVFEYLVNHDPDIVVNVLDATSLERNLYLTTQLIDMNLNLVVALNMYDEFRKKRDHLKYDKLGGMLGVPFVPTVARKGKGIESLLKKIIRVFEEKEESVRQVDIPYNREIEQAISILQERLGLFGGTDNRTVRFSRYFALRLLEGDIVLLDGLPDGKPRQELIGETRDRIAHIDSYYLENTSSLITGDRYGFIEGALQETLIPGGREKVSISGRIDNILTHRILGFPIFFGVILLVFYLTFSIGGHPVRWLEQLIEWFGGSTGELLPPGILNDLVTQGIIPGVGAVAIFLPNIIILFLFISFLEDTGYMARMAFIVDRIMHRAGLHGKSFIPLMIGFGCNVPAIMATRTIEDRRNRLITMMIIPFMSCSARIPVYVLFISAFFASWKPLILFALYLTGIIMAWLTALLFGRFIFRKAETPFVMELPPYRLPTGKAVLRHMWFKTYYFIRKMGGVILLASVLIWLLEYLPAGPGKAATPTEGMNEEMAGENAMSKIEHSYIGMLGKWIQPVFRPLGFDWEMSVSVLAGLPAKEIVVSTLGVLYHSASGVGNSEQSIRESWGGEGFDRQTLRALSFMVFILLYFPCIGTLTVLKKESGSMIWPVLTLGYTTAVAWIASFLIFQLGSVLVH